MRLIVGWIVFFCDFEDRKRCVMKTRSFLRLANHTIRSRKIMGFSFFSLSFRVRLNSVLSQLSVENAITKTETRFREDFLGVE